MAGHTFIPDSHHFCLLPTAKRFVTTLADIAGLKSPAELEYLFAHNFPPLPSACERILTAAYNNETLE
jgi:hypothetical protein